MAGIVKATSKRIVVNKKMREIITPTAVLDTDTLFADLTPMSGENSTATLVLEMNRLPTIVKQEAEIVITAGSIAQGIVRGMNGNTKTVEQLTFDRASNAVSQYSTGAMYLRDAHWPRVVYDGGFRGYLFEPASTNMVLYSGLGNYGAFEAFHPSHRTGLTVVQDTGKTCVKVPSKANCALAIISVVAGKTYTYSFWIKAASNFQMRFSNYDGTTTYNHYVVDITTTWKRVVKTFTVQAGSTTDFSHIYNVTNAAIPDIFIGDIQLEEGGIATSYIPTTNATATRLSDKMTGQRAIASFQFNTWYMESDLFTGWFGNYNMKGRNLFPNSNASSYFAGYMGATLTKTDNVSVPEWGATDANRVVSSGGTNGIRVLQMVTVPAQGEQISVSGWFKNNGTTAINVYSNQGARLDRLEPGQQKRVLWEGIVGNGVGSVQFQINPVNISDNVDFTWWRLQHEKGATVTPWTPDPSDFVKITGGNVEVSSQIPNCIRSLSMVARQLKDSEY